MAVKVDEKVKNDIEKLYNRLGMNINTAVNIFFQQCLIEQVFHFNKKQRVNTYRSKNALKITMIIIKQENGTQENPWEENVINTDRNIAIHIKLDKRTATTGVVMTDQVKALDLTTRNAKFIEKIPNDILSKICDIISGFTEIEKTEI